jgi:hypothetical protein
MLSPQTYRSQAHAMPKNSSKKWTPEDDKRLLELKAAGMSGLMIAAALRRSLKSINLRVRFSKMRKHSEAPIEE